MFSRIDTATLRQAAEDARLNVLGGIIGGKAGPIVTTVGGAVLTELGVTTAEQAVRWIETDPEAVARLCRLEAERGPEWAAVALAEQRMAHLLADRESEQRGFAYWWRPGACTSISISGCRTRC